MDVAHKQEYRIRDLGTRTVTLFPSRAQIVREIKDVPLKPGANQITFIGLTPTVDEQSIKVEGTGSAIITDIAVELLPNREIFQDIYPDEESESDSDSELDEESDDGKDSEELQAVRTKLDLLQDESKRAKELIASAESRLKFLNSYGNALTTERKHKVPEVKNIDAGVEMYRREREKVFRDHMDGLVKERDIAKKIIDLSKEEERLAKLAAKEKVKIAKLRAKALKVKEKQKEKEARKQREKAREKARIRKERESFWPKKVYTVKVSLDAASFTPMSSRRNSISSDIVKVVSEKDSETDSNEYAGTCDLSVSYLTADASWSPSYDLALSTTSSSGHLCFDARLTNTTSETWSNAKVILSTSHTDFTGLNDTIPLLQPWRVRLAGKGAAGNQNDVLYSRDEQSYKAGWNAQQNARQIQRPRWENFGLDKSDENPFITGGLFGAPPQAAIPPPAPAPAPAPARRAYPAGAFGGSLFGNTSSYAAPGASSGFGQAPPGGGLLAASAAPPQAAGESARDRKGDGFPPPTRVGGLFGSIGAAKKSSRPSDLRAATDKDEESLSDYGPTIMEPQPELGFQESSFEETGFTTTYDLPGLKTIIPSLTASKQRVARVTFASVTFNYTCIPKYKPVAYLKAKLRNGSKMTLLKGPTGLTLDGSFMGRTDLPRCSPGDAFSLSLGVDPAIKVIYPKPDVKRSQSGLFSKEDSGIYTRTITLMNTRSAAKSKPVQLTVLDQVPVSEDDRLRVEILQPRGLALNGAHVSAAISTGLPGKEGKDEQDWGKAAARLKKGGEVSWDVTLNAGRAVKLGLEYECTFPTSEHVVNV